MTPTRLFDFAYYALEQHPRPDALNTKINGQWESLSTADYVAKAEKLALGLIALGVQPGDKIAIISTNNRTEWNLCDQAILSAGAIDVPVYPTISSEDYRFIFNDAEVKYCFLSDADLFHKVKAIQAEVPSLKEIYSFVPVDGCAHWDEVFALADEAQRPELTAQIGRASCRERV